MPKYRFITVGGDKLDLNPSWIDFPSDEAASRDAQRALADMANDQLPDGSHFELRIAVENRAGEVVYQASLDFHGETAEEMRSNTDQTDRAAMNGSAGRCRRRSQRYQAKAWRHRRGAARQRDRAV